MYKSISIRFCAYVNLQEARLNRLSPTMSAVYNSSKADELRRRSCTPNTRTTVINKVKSWAHKAGAEAAYWMNGMAGTGKTTIAFSLCTELEEDKLLGASFFCSHLLPECRDVNLILPSVAYQLARFSLPFRSALAKMLEEDPDVHTRALKIQFERLLVRPLIEIKDTLPQVEVVVILDALDECENGEGVGQLLELLIRHELSLPIKFFLSSRPEAEIYPRLMRQMSEQLRPHLILHELDATSVRQDIQTYLLDELEGLELSDAQLASLVDQSGVLFIYAATVARYLKDGHAMMELDERLDLILGLSTFPSRKDRELDLLYTTILRRAFENPKLEAWGSERMKRVLDTVICAQEPLTVAALAGLLKMKNAKQVDALLQSLRSVININGTSGLVTTLHSSFPDFMLNQNRATTYYCRAAIYHGEFAQACFDVIRNNVPQFNICALKSSYFLDSEITDLDERADRVVSREMFYACRYWATHLDFNDEPDDIVEGLHEFLSARLLLWMEVLNVKKCIGLGADIIWRAEMWCMVSSLSDEVYISFLMHI